jgi:hypothetical protein
MDHELPTTSSIKFTLIAADVVKKIPYRAPVFGTQLGRGRRCAIRMEHVSTSLSKTT